MENYFNIFYSNGCLYIVNLLQDWTDPTVQELMSVLMIGLDSNAILITDDGVYYGTEDDGTILIPMEKEDAISYLCEVATDFCKK